MSRFLIIFIVVFVTGCAPAQEIDPTNPRRFIEPQPEPFPYCSIRSTVDADGKPVAELILAEHSTDREQRIGLREFPAAWCGPNGRDPYSPGSQFVPWAFIRVGTHDEPLKSVYLRFLPCCGDVVSGQYRVELLDGTPMNGMFSAIVDAVESS